MSIEHYKTPLDGGPSGEIGKMLFSGIRETGRMVLGVGGVIVQGIPEIPAMLHIRTPER